MMIMIRLSSVESKVKAVAWSPHQSGLLASGGGTADRHIRFWNALTSVPLHKIDTGSQVRSALTHRSIFFHSFSSCICIRFVTSCGQRM